MTESKKAMEMELRQIIEADEQAVKILQGAEKTRKALEAQTQAEKQDLLQDIDKKRQRITRRAEQQIEEQLQTQLHQEQLQHQQQLQQLEQKVQKNHRRWADDITARILNQTP